MCNTVRCRRRWSRERYINVFIKNSRKFLKSLSSTTHLCINCLYLGLSEDLNIIINTRQGKVRGDTRYSYTGRCYGAFQGIPYAQPPINERRFLRPKPIKSWPEGKILDATKPSAVRCMQPDGPPYPSQNATEDCLYLWIYSPAVCKETTDSKRKSRFTLIFSIYLF